MTVCVYDYKNLLLNKTFYEFFLILMALFTIKIYYKFGFTYVRVHVHMCINICVYTCIYEIYV